MTDPPPTAPARPHPPGHDEILVTPPPGRCLCNNLAHRRLGCLADVIITFGQLGTAWQKDALWQSNWGKSFPMCQRCWDSVRQVATERRPGLVITTSPPGHGAPASGPPATRP